MTDSPPSEDLSVDELPLTRDEQALLSLIAKNSPVTQHELYQLAICCKASMPPRDMFGVILARFTRQHLVSTDAGFQIFTMTDEGIEHVQHVDFPEFDLSLNSHGLNKKLKEELAAFDDLPAHPELDENLKRLESISSQLHQKMPLSAELVEWAVDELKRAFKPEEQNRR